MINLFVNFSSSIASSISSLNHTATVTILSFALNILFILISSYLYMNIIKISLEYLDKGSSNLDRLIESKTFSVFLKTYLLYILIIIAGIVLLIVPGIIWAIKYRFAPYFVIDKSMAPSEAFKQSAKITDGVKLSLLWFNILISLIILAGLLVFFIGIFLAYPVAWMAEVIIYRNLLTQTKKAGDSS